MNKSFHIIKNVLNIEPIDLLLNKNCKHYFKNKNILREDYKSKYNIEKEKLEEFFDNFLKKVINKVEKLKNDMLKQMINTFNFDKTYSVFKTSVDNFLDKISNKIHKIPKTGDLNLNNSYNSDVLAKELINLKYQKEQVSKLEDLFINIKEDYTKFKINENIKEIDDLLNKNNFFIDYKNINNKFIKIENQINNDIDNIIIENSFQKSLKIQESNIISNNFKYTITKSNNFIKNNSEYKFNSQINNNIKYIDNKFTIKEKPINIKSNNYFPYISDNHDEVVINDYFINPKINRRELILELKNINSFDFNNNMVVLGTTSGIVYLYDIKNLENFIKSYDLRCFIKNIKFIKNNLEEIQIFIQFYNENSKIISFENNKIKIFCLNYESKDVISDLNCHYNIIYDDTLALFCLETKNLINMIKLDKDINKLVNIGKNKLLVSSINGYIYIIDINNSQFNIIKKIENFENISFIKKIYNNDKIILLQCLNSKIKIFDIDQNKIRNEIFLGDLKIQDSLFIICSKNDPIINCLLYDGNMLYYNQIDFQKSIKIGQFKTVKNSSLKILNYNKNSLDILYIDGNGLGILNLNTS